MHIVIATDVRFWRRKTGAEQRIFELVQFLHRRVANDGSNEVTAIFVGSMNGADRRQIEGLDLIVWSLVDDWQPQGAIQKYHWKWRCFLNLLRTVNRNNRFSKDSADSKPSGERPAKRLDDFNSAEMKLRFQQLVHRIRPTIVIVEYITLAYLVPRREQRNGLIYAVDTHDCLAHRCEQFHEHGFGHWIELTRGEESAALDVFDIIIAIQRQEAETFKKMVTGNQPVIVVGHCVNQPVRLPFRISPENQVTMGILASDNAANRHSIQWFVEHVWPRVVSANSEIEFLIAGSICDWFVAQTQPLNWSCMGRVEQVADFYQAVSIVVNPIQFGTGLKIKNVEAIAFGRPLVTTEPSIHGVADLNAAALPWLVARTADEMVQHLVKLSQDAKWHRQLADSAARYAATEQSATKVYAPLVELLSKLAR